MGKEGRPLNGMAISLGSTVPQVRVASTHEISVAFPHGHGPQFFFGLIGREFQSVTQGFIATEHASAPRTQGDHDASGQGGHVHDRRWLQLGARIRQCIGHDQSSFGIGIGHLNGGSIHHGDDVVGTVCGGIHHVFCTRQQGADANGQVSLRDQQHRAQYPKATTAVVLHAKHAVVDFEGIPSGVIGHGFAHEDQVLVFWRIFMVVLQHHHARRGF